MEITIGVQNLARELTVETDATAEEITKAVTAALSGGPVLELTDSKGRKVLVPSSTIGYIEIGTEEQRKVGFGSI